jgi:hypothetical protein
MKNLEIKATIAAIVFAIFLTGCPASDPLRSAVEASYRLPAATNDVVAKVTIARDRGYITAEQARSFGAVLNDLARGEVEFVKLARLANARFKQTGTFDAATQTELRSYFDGKIVEQFLAVVDLLRTISGPDLGLIVVAIAAVRALIKKIAGGIGSHKLAAVAGLRPRINIQQGLTT